MSEREYAMHLLNEIPESRLFYVISFLQGAAVPDETPNEETVAAMQEVEEMIRAGSGQHFQGSVADFFASED